MDKEHCICLGLSFFWILLAFFFFSSYSLPVCSYVLVKSFSLADNDLYMFGGRAGEATCI